MPRKAAVAKKEPAPTLEQFSQQEPVVRRDDWHVPLRADWNAMSLDECHALIQKYHAAYKEGADILNQRTYDQARESGVYVCMVCRKKKPMTVDNHPNFVWRDDRKDPNTGLYDSKMICSQDCFFRGSNSGKLTNAGIAANIHK